MKKTKKLVSVLIIALLLNTLAGCSYIFKKEDGSTPKSGGETQSKSTTEETVSSSEDKKIQDIINTFVKELYSIPVTEKMGNISKLETLLANQTVSEGKNNPEVPVHQPRYVELNGMTIIGYELIDQGKEGIEAKYIGQSGEGYVYFIKIPLKAKCVSNGVFDTRYERNADNTYTVKSNVENNEIDYMKVLAKYDIKVVKEKEGYKVLSAKEASYKSDSKSRLLKLSNEFMDKLSYIVEKDEAYIKESAVVEAYFNNLLAIDDDRMDLLRYGYEAGLGEFKSYLDKVGITKDKDGKELLLIEESYKNDFPYRSFPLKEGMGRISRYNNFNVIVHPGYTDNIKRYIVRFDACIENLNGILGDKTVYTYDYNVELDAKNSNIKIKKVKLNASSKSIYSEAYLSMANLYIKEEKNADAELILQNGFFETGDGKLKEKLALIAPKIDILTNTASTANGQ